MNCFCGEHLAITFLWYFSILDRVVSVHDVEEYLDYIRSNYTTTFEWTFDLHSQRTLRCYRELVARIERCGLSILLPTKPNSFIDEELFLTIVSKLFWFCKLSEIDTHLKFVICRSGLFINVLSSHLFFCTVDKKCDTSNVLMARYVSRYVNSNSSVHLLNSDFLQHLVFLLRSKRQHVLLFALEALYPLLCSKKKHLRKFLKLFFSIEVGFGLEISNILRQYATNGLRDMTTCDCESSFSSTEDCAALCMNKLYEVSGCSKNN